jgi:hypothetical protein
LGERTGEFWKPIKSASDSDSFFFLTQGQRQLVKDLLIARMKVGYKEYGIDLFLHLRMLGIQKEMMLTSFASFH